MVFAACLFDTCQPSGVNYLSLNSVHKSLQYFAVNPPDLLANLSCAIPIEDERLDQRHPYVADHPTLPKFEHVVTAKYIEVAHMLFHSVAWKRNRCNVIIHTHTLCLFS